MRYGDVLATVRDLALFDELVAATQRQYELLRSRVEEGASPPLERDLVDVDLRRAQAERLLQAGRTETAMFELKRVLGMKADAALAVRDTFEDLVQRESAAAPQIPGGSTAVDERADVREAAARVETAVAKIDRAKSDGRFDVSLFANYMRMDAGFPQQGFGPDGGLERVRGQFNYWSAGATLRLPVVNRNQGEVAMAHAEQTGASAVYDAARLAAEAELASARVRDERAREAVRIFSGGGQALARQNLAVVSQSYELGRVTVFEVLAERRRYLDVERAYTEALRACVRSTDCAQPGAGRREMTTDTRVTIAPWRRGDGRHRSAGNRSRGDVPVDAKQGRRPLPEDVACLERATASLLRPAPRATHRCLRSPFHSVGMRLSARESSWRRSPVERQERSSVSRESFRRMPTARSW